MDVFYLVKSSLLAGGKHYDLLVDWKKRLSYEIPFLIDCFKNIKPPVKTILEVGCGTGHHAQILHKNWGYKVTGVDIDESMIEEARIRVPSAELFVHNFLNPDFLLGRSFDAIISLGNSVGLIASMSDFRNVVTRFSKLIRKPHGILVFHLLNTEKERNGWSAPRSVVTTEGEYIFLRGFTTTEMFIHPEIITLFRPNNGQEWQMTTTGKANIPRIDIKTMSSLLQEFGFRDIKVFGNYQRISFQSSSSADMIFKCHF